MQSHDRARIAIVLHRDQDAAAWRERHARGETMDVTPYGYERAGDRYDIVWSQSVRERGIARAVRVRVAAILGFDLIHVWRNRRIVFGADIVWTHTEREHLAVAALQRLRRRSRRVPVIAQSVWLWDAWQTWSPLRRRFIGSLLRTHAVEAVHSTLNHEVSLSAVPGRRVVVVPFGSAPVTRDAPHPLGARPLVLAVGNDADRDWDALAAAVDVEGIEVRVASKSRAARNASWPGHVVVAPTATLEELAGLYRSAAVVVVPVRPNLHASGATSCIEALAARRPLVVTDAGGLGDYVDGAAILVPPGDSAALAEAIRATLGAPPPPGDPWVERGLTHVDYVERYVLLTRWLLGEIDLPGEVSRFAPVIRR